MKVENLIEARVRLTNADDPDRIHAIAAEAYYSGGQCQHIQSGEIRELPEAEPQGEVGDYTVLSAPRENPEGRILASFSTYAPNAELNINFSTATDRSFLMEEAESFIADAASCLNAEMK